VDALHPTCLPLQSRVKVEGSKGRVGRVN